MSFTPYFPLILVFSTCVTYFISLSGIKKNLRANRQGSYCHFKIFSLSIRFIVHYSYLIKKEFAVSLELWANSIFINVYGFFSPMGEIFLLCHLLIHTCLWDTGFSAKVLRVSWNASHATVLLNNELESKDFLSWEFQEKGGKEEGFSLRWSGLLFFFLSSSKGTCVLFKKLIAVLSHVLSVPKMWKAQLLSNSFLEHVWENRLSSMSFITRWAVTASEKVTKDFPV